MMKYTRAYCDTSKVSEWILEEGIHEAQIITIQLTEDGSYLIWYRAQRVCGSTATAGRRIAPRWLCDQRQLTRRKTMRFLYTIFCVLTAMVGYTIHKSLGWAIMDFLFCPIAWAKWLICHEVTLSIIKSTFTWFFA